MCRASLILQPSRASWSLPCSDMHWPGGWGGDFYIKYFVVLCVPEIRSLCYAMPTWVLQESTNTSFTHALTSPRQCFSKCVQRSSSSERCATTKGCHATLVGETLHADSSGGLGCHSDTSTSERSSQTSAPSPVLFFRARSPSDCYVCLLLSVCPTPTMCHALMTLSVSCSTISLVPRMLPRSIK